MIAGLVQILLFQGLGELLSRFLLPIIPGPVLGLSALLVFLTLRRQVGESMAVVADAFSQHLGLLFVPAAVGVVLFLPQLRANFVALSVVLLISVALTLAATALVLRWLSANNTEP